MSRPPSVLPYVPGPAFSPPHLLASIAQEGQTASASFPTTSKKRPASNAVRAGRLSAPKRIRTSKDEWSESQQPQSAADPLRLLESAPEHESNALTNHTFTSSTSNCEDNVLAVGKVPDTVTVLGRGPPPSRPAKRTRQGNKKKTPYLSTEFNCHICKTGFVRLPELERHNGTAGHAEQARQEGIEVVIEVNDSLRCPVPRCKIVKPYSRRDALMRHMREKHPRVPIPRT
ncbi:hypothetical protein HETIRDRAFT_419616 [Heterobasidion irregulare TC 32-1]|uniref:C2H2-type domain-containing protein n=1 Tax=Heterobasidion irregulare (strain TC 32-1) TaxID=747525 RepID=W4K4M2_HETIT|nr:uncharacterized protein HETIRDRAFT_419616 [Heterobasidion irregulare TC 32-1]ETW80001.1 hypothetical protein HETIRDRAFT_419616 [Heterobasidion irregulare TC 32-1]